jgi:hypothetical protein
VLLVISGARPLANLGKMPVNAASTKPSLGWLAFHLSSQKRAKAYHSLSRKAKQFEQWRAPVSTSDVAAGEFQLSSTSQQVFYQTRP